MSKGSRVIPVRMPDALLAAAREAMEAINLTRKEKPFDLSEFIRTAVREKIAKRERGRKGRGKSPA